MKRNIEANIQSRALFNKIFLPLIISAAWVIMRYILLSRYQNSLGLDVIHAIIVFAVGIYIQFYLIVYLIEGVIIDNTHLQFSGSISEYVKISLLGMFFSLITLGIYLPWYLRNIYRFFAENTSYRGSSASFNGIPQSLLKYIVIFFIGYILFIFLGVEMVLNERIFLLFVFFIILLSWIMGLVNIQLIWSLQISFRGYTTSCTATKVEGALFLLGQFLLSSITLGFYIPWAYLRIITFYTKKLHIKNSAGDRVFLSFLPESGDGLLILGQAILTCITLGIYRPFAMGNIANRLLPRVKMEIPHGGNTDYVE